MANSDDPPRTDPNPGTVSAIPPQLEAATPDVSSGARARPSSPTIESDRSDTLLSAPAQASKEDLALDERLSDCERRLEEMNARLETLERRPVELRTAEPRIRWFWLLFLAAVALAWQIVSHLR